MRTKAIERLTAHSIKPSAQRIAIMEYMLTHNNHPTVDVIYNDLVGSMPTLSKTTIYSTLKLLAEQGAITALTIDKNAARFDGDTGDHSHFQCRRCGKITDIINDINMIVSEPTYRSFVIDNVEINYRGLCARCLAEIKGEKYEPKY